MSGFCACKTEGYPNLCNAEGDQQCSWYCKNYEQGKLAPMYPVPAKYHVSLDEEMSGMVFADILLKGDKLFYSGS